MQNSIILARQWGEISPLAPLPPLQQLLAALLQWQEHPPIAQPWRLVTRVKKILSLPFALDSPRRPTKPAATTMLAQQRRHLHLLRPQHRLR